MNYHVFHDSFTDDIEHSGIFDFFPNICIKENKSGDFGRVEGSCENVCVKGSEAPTRPTPVCYDLSVRRESKVSSHPHR